VSYAIYVVKNHNRAGYAWPAGYGDEPSLHWLDILPATDHPDRTTIEVGVGPEADMPGRRITVPQGAQTLRHLRVRYSHYLGVPAPMTNGGVNEAGVAVRDHPGYLCRRTSSASRANGAGTIVGPSTPTPYVAKARGAGRASNRSRPRCKPARHDPKKSGWNT
jgi:hypothetical protein